MPRFELNILGCGSAKPTMRHLPSCQVLNVRDNLMMIDCGEGAQLALAKQRLKFMRLSHIFISHTHGDHFFGIPGLLSTLGLSGRTTSLTIHVFEDGAKFIESLLQSFCSDLPFEVKLDVLTVGRKVIYEDDAITVTTFPLAHRVPAVGFIFAEKPKMRHINPTAVAQHAIPHYAMNSLRQGLDYVSPDGTVIPNAELTTDAEPSHSYAYCSDTAYSKRVIKAIQGVDWLYHEATYGDECMKQAKNRHHSTARQAALVAKEAGVKQLILGHFSSRYTDETPLLQQAQEEFPATRLANEAQVINLNNP